MIKQEHIIDSLKITTIEIPNKVYRNYLENSDNSKEKTDHVWFSKDICSTMSEELLTQLKTSSLVKAQDFDHITSFSFTRQSFYDKNWNTVNTMARGLFVNNVTKEIVARSYKKFFNLNENPEHTLDQLQQTLAFPVDIYEKENGFLGIVGYDTQTNTLFITSKSNPESPFADNFRRIFNNTFDEGKRSTIKRLLRDQKATMVFEVNDPINDPHMIEYDKEHLVLLDVIARDENFIKADYDYVKSIAKKFGVKVKKRLAKINSWDNLVGFIKNVEAKDDYFTHTQIEGYVYEDSAGFMFKQKTNYYSFWKSMRTMKDRKASSIEKNKVFDKKTRENNNLSTAFVNYLDEQSLDTLKSDIITVRNNFITEYNSKDGD